MDVFSSSPFSNLVNLNKAALLLPVLDAVVPDRPSMPSPCDTKMIQLAGKLTPTPVPSFFSLLKGHHKNIFFLDDCQVIIVLFGTNNHVIEKF